MRTWDTHLLSTRQCIAALTFVPLDYSRSFCLCTCTPTQVMLQTHKKEGDLFGTVASNTWQQQEACRDMKSVKVQLHSNVPQAIFALK